MGRRFSLTGSTKIELALCARRELRGSFPEASSLLSQSLFECLGMFRSMATLDDHSALLSVARRRERGDGDLITDRYPGLCGDEE
ncbi:hypothetical protein A6X20_24740 [Bradyrhizobium elkanii]|nr:hypothetical protein A6X20_24740 [Bradyrhizobium elkanii]ODM81509.1 hypothetical protein A6452_22510 [Bradyrhizobium elkanii]